MAAQLFGDRLDLARRNALDIHLGQRRPQLPAPGPRTRRRNPRKLARSQPLPPYGLTPRAVVNRTTPTRLTTTMSAFLPFLSHSSFASTPQSHLPAPLFTLLFFFYHHLSFLLSLFLFFFSFFFFFF